MTYLFLDIYFHCQCHSAPCDDLVLFRLLARKPGVFWWDNFGGKAFSVAIQGIDLGSYKQPLWTGFGFHEYVGDKDVKMSIDVLKPGMPAKLFTQEVKDMMKKMMKGADKMGYKYLEKSIVHKYNVRRVPCKPEVDPVKEAQLHNILQESRDGLVDFYPTELMDINIGSNRGLFQILRTEYDKVGDELPPRYVVLSADYNIFMRILKVRHGWSARVVSSGCVRVA